MRIAVTKEDESDIGRVPCHHLHSILLNFTQFYILLLNFAQFYLFSTQFLFNSYLFSTHFFYLHLHLILPYLSPFNFYPFYLLLFNLIFIITYYYKNFFIPDICYLHKFPSLFLNLSLFYSSFSPKWFYYFLL